MALKKFADRMYITVNGYQLLHCTSGTISVDDAAQEVDTMTRDYTIAGVRYGNRKISIEVEIDVERLLAQVDLNTRDSNSAINLVAECGGERYTCKDIFRKNMSMQSSVGSASKRISLGARNIVNENGDMVDTVMSIALA